MKEKLAALLQEGTEKILGAQSEAELQEIRSALLGKQGSITELLKEIVPYIIVPIFKLGHTAEIFSAYQQRKP